MSNRMRWRYGDTNPVVGYSPKDSHVEIGDLVYQIGFHIFPFEVAGRHSEFKQKFLGVAMQESRLGEESAVRVATTGVFEFQWQGNRFPLGTLVTAIDKQTLVSTTSLAEAIARVARANEYDSPDTVLVDIISTLMRGGVQ